MSKRISAVFREKMVLQDKIKVYKKDLFDKILHQEFDVKLYIKFISYCNSEMEDEDYLYLYLDKPSRESGNVYNIEGDDKEDEAICRRQFFIHNTIHKAKNEEGLIPFPPMLSIIREDNDSVYYWWGAHSYIIKRKIFYKAMNKV